MEVATASVCHHDLIHLERHSELTPTTGRDRRFLLNSSFINISALYVLHANGFRVVSPRQSTVSFSYSLRGCIFATILCSARDKSCQHNTHQKSGRYSILSVGVELRIIIWETFCDAATCLVIWNQAAEIGKRYHKKSGHKVRRL